MNNFVARILINLNLKRHNKTVKSEQAQYRVRFFRGLYVIQKREYIPPDEHGGVLFKEWKTIDSSNHLSQMLFLHKDKLKC